MVILDTCAVIETCKAKPSFSKKTLEQMHDNAVILSISFAEIACQVKFGKLIMDVTPNALFLEFSRIETIKTIDIGVHEWLDAIDMEWDENKDPADRVITAWAIQNQIPIVTRDQKIMDFYKHVIW
jgi:PIN domain nuclease of toxin-antitoxin system